MNSEISFLKKYVLPVSVVVVMATLLFPGVAAHAAVVLESGIPGVGEGGRQGAELPGLATYINYLYIFVLSFVGIAGFISIVVWGTVWVSSAVADQKTRALEGIKNTLIGIGIALTAFIMLTTINPDLTVIKIPKIEPLKKATVFNCQQYSAVTCPISQNCINTTAGCINNPNSSTSVKGACLMNKVVWEKGGWNVFNKNLASDNCYNNCNMYAETQPSCSASASTTAFIVGKTCGELYVQSTVWSGNCSINTYNANAF